MIRQLALGILLSAGSAVAEPKGGSALPTRIEITDMHVIPAAGLDPVPILASAYVDVRDLPTLVKQRQDIPARLGEVCSKSGCRQIKMSPTSSVTTPAKLPAMPKE